MTTNTADRVTRITEYRTSNIVFSDPKEEPIPQAPGSKGPKLVGRRIQVGYKYSDGKIGSLIFPVEFNRHSFGISVNRNKDNPEKVDGHSLSLCLYSKPTATPEEMAWVRWYDDVLLKDLKEHLLKGDTKIAIKQPKLTMEKLEKMGQLYRKKDESGNVIDNPTQGPTFYPKLIEKKSTGTILTIFKDSTGNDLDYKDLIGVPLTVERCLIRVESIYVGTNISVQMKVYEARVRRIDRSHRSLLGDDFEPAAAVEESAGPARSLISSTNDDESSDDVDIDDDTPAAPPPATAAAAVKSINVPRKARS